MLAIGLGPVWLNPRARRTAADADSFMLKLARRSQTTGRQTGLGYLRSGGRKGMTTYLDKMHSVARAEAKWFALKYAASLLACALASAGLLLLALHLVDQL